MSDLNILAEASPTILNASALLTKAYPGYLGTLYLTKEGLDPNHDLEGPIEVGSSEVAAIDAFAGKSASLSLVASPASQPDQPACFALWFQPGTRTPVKKLPPSLHLQAEDGRQVLVYHVDGSANDILVMRGLLEPEEDASYQLSADVPFGRAWTLSEGSTFKRYCAAEVDTAFFQPDDEGQSGAVFGLDPRCLVFGHLYDCILDHPIAASRIWNYKKTEADNIAADVRGLFNHISTHRQSESKEGLAIIGADLDNDAKSGKPRRKIDNTRSVSFIGYDFDSGQSPEFVIAALRSRSVAFGIYSSHSHLRDGKTPKFRVIIPLREPFDTAAYPSRKEANKAWKASYEAFGDGLGLEYDPATKDIARLFNSPRHAKGRPFFSQIYAGKLFDLPIVQPEQMPVVKAARKAGRKVEYRPNGDVYVAEGSGLNFFLSLIGDGEGRTGFYSPIWRALCSYFGSRGPHADVKEIVSLVQAAVEAAPKSTGRDQSAIDRYLSAEYLMDQAERARAFIADQHRSLATSSLV